MNRAVLATLICANALAIGSVAKASDPLAPQAAVEARQAGFKKMGAALKALTDQLKRDAPDASTLAASTQILLAGAEKLPQWFPAGSSAEPGTETDALPNVWTDRAKFDALATELITEVKSLSATIATKDAAAIGAQAKRTASVCSTCHRSFRAD